MQFPMLFTAAALACVAFLNAHASASAEAVVATYADMAQAGYEDSLRTAQVLDKAIAALIAKPSEATLAAARQALLAARVL